MVVSRYHDQNLNPSERGSDHRLTATNLRDFYERHEAKMLNLSQEIAVSVVNNRIERIIEILTERAKLLEGTGRS